jgi:hypothetical protein
MFKSYRPLISLVSLIFVSFFLYQNCSSEEFRAVGSSNDNLGLVNVDVGKDHPNVRRAITKAEVQPLYMNRRSVTHLYRDIFGPSINREAAIHLGWATTDVGSSWSPYQVLPIGNAICDREPTINFLCRNSTLDLRTPPNTGINAAREGRRMSVCYHGVQEEESFNFALNRIQEGRSQTNLPDLSEANLHRLFELFFRGRPLPPTSFFDSLELLIQNSETPEKGWQNALLTVCTSPHWQVL